MPIPVLQVVLQSSVIVNAAVAQLQHVVPWKLASLSMMVHVNLLGPATSLARWHWMDAQVVINNGHQGALG